MIVRRSVPSPPRRWPPLLLAAVCAAKALGYNLERGHHMAQWISVTEAAQASGYDADYIRKLIRGGKLKARKVITVWQVDRASLAAYMQLVEKMGGKRGPKKGG